ncbi:MAG: MFS transporter, partial [Actinobacteria bacterium]|nr:MFS transporter [Actinomycetota bacterium]
MAGTREQRRPTGPAAAFALMRERNFGPYFAGNAISAAGTWFHALAAGLLVYRETSSEVLLGVLAFGQFAPLLVLGPWAGVAADRFDRRRVIVSTQLVAAALATALAGLAWAGLATTWVTIGISVGLGAAGAVATPAAQAFVGSLVAPNQLASAIGLNSMTYNLARAVGPALAGLLVAGAGIPAAFTVNAVSYLALVAGVALVRAHPDAGGPAAAGGRFLDTVRLVVRDPVLAGLLAIVAIAGITSDPINTLSPAFALAFGRPDEHAGYLIGVFGAGAVAAALLLAGRVTASRARMGLTLTLLGGGLLAFSVTRLLPLALVFLFVAGFGFLASNTAATAQL